MWKGCRRMTCRGRHYFRMRGSLCCQCRGPFPVSFCIGHPFGSLDCRGPSLLRVHPGSALGSLPLCPCMFLPCLRASSAWIWCLCSCLAWSTPPTDFPVCVWGAIKRGKNKKGKKQKKGYKAGFTSHICLSKSSWCFEGGFASLESIDSSRVLVASLTCWS